MSGEGLLRGDNGSPDALNDDARAVRHAPPHFSPSPGFDPMDGAEPHVALSRDNPCRAGDSE